VPIAALGGLLYFVLGPTPPPAPTIGWLQPGNYPTPDNGCGTHPERAGEDAVLLIAGSDGYIVPRLNSSTQAITLGWCQSLTLHSTKSGLAIDAQIFGHNGTKIGYIENNGYNIDGNIFVDKDSNTIAIHDADGQELLWVRYLNDRAIKVRGKLFCPAPHPITVEITNKNITDHAKNTYAGDCSIAGRFGMVIE
jgi:hypothetical protein